MEIVGEDGSKTRLIKGSKIVFGRGSGFNSDDRTISRYHVSLELHADEGQANSSLGFKVCFEVIGKNPIWVHDCRSKKIRVFRKLEMGEMVSGDEFCVSAKRHIWFKLIRKEYEDEHNERSDDDFGLELPNFSEIDPVKDFGFLVSGHEFDSYKLHNIKNWDWFLKETKNFSEDDECLSLKRKRGTKGKKKSDDPNDILDEDWMDESKEVVGVLSRQPKYYSMRSNANHAHRSAATSFGNRIISDDKEGVDEDDDTLGGFIVNDDVIEKVEMGTDEEEEFDDDDSE